MSNHIILIHPFATFLSRLIQGCTPPTQVTLGPKVSPYDTSSFPILASIHPITIQISLHRDLITDVLPLERDADKFARTNMEQIEEFRRHRREKSQWRRGMACSHPDALITEAIVEDIIEKILLVLSRIQ